MKWVGMYLVGFIVLIGGILAALWKLGMLQRIGTVWTLIGVAILIGIGIMLYVFSVSTAFISSPTGTPGSAFETRSVIADLTCATLGAEVSFDDRNRW